MLRIWTQLITGFVLAFIFVSSVFVALPIFVQAQSCAGDGELVQEDDGKPYPPEQQYVADGRCCSGQALTGGPYRNARVCSGGGFNFNFKPELTAGTTTASGLIAGETTTISGSITNSFVATNLSFENRIQLDYGADGVWDENYQIPMDGIGQLETKTTSIDLILDAGTYKSRACADVPLDDIDEVDETNNCGPETIFEVTGPDLTAGQPSLNSGTLVNGENVTFASLISNNGSADATGTFDVRFQIDVGNDGVYDTNLDSLDEIASLAASASDNGFSQAWTAQLGTHAIRACADLPGDDNSESNEGNNCGANYVFVINAQCNDNIDNDGDGDIDFDDPGCDDTSDNLEADNPECSDGFDNDGDGDTDYPDDPGCNNVFDAQESSAPPINFALFEADPELVRSGNTTSLNWQVTAAKVGSCVISGTNGDNFGLTGLSGTRTSGQIFGITIFTLTCEDLEGANQSISTTARVVPKFNEI